MSFEIPKIGGDEQMLRLFDDFRNRIVTCKHSGGGVYTDHFSQIEEAARRVEIYAFCRIWSTERIEVQLEALSNLGLLEQDIMFLEYAELSKQARLSGNEVEFEEFIRWRRDMRSLHAVLVMVYKERINERLLKLSPKKKERSNWFRKLF
jgi:hypothetical protein